LRIGANPDPVGLISVANGGAYRIGQTAAVVSCVSSSGESVACARSTHERPIMGDTYDTAEEVARHRIEIEPTHRTLDRQMYRVWHQGKVLVESAWDPEFTACRALMALGIRGRLECQLIGAAHAGLRLDIERGAGLRTIESRDDGPRIGKWVPFGGVEAEHAFPALAVEQGRQSASNSIERGPE
jgi:hypothetical protein